MDKEMLSCGIFAKIFGVTVSTWRIRTLLLEKTFLIIVWSLKFEIKVGLVKNSPN